MGVMMLAEPKEARRAPEFRSCAAIGELQRLFPARRHTYITHVLSEAELNCVCDLKDALILARIKRMTPARLKRFDQFIPIDSEQQKAYTLAQMEWLKHEHYLLGTRLGRSPNHAELYADFTAHRNGQRFRAYYVLKHPERMKRDRMRGAEMLMTVGR